MENQERTNSSKNFEEESKGNLSESVTIKKSTYNNLIRGIVAAIAIATFVGGYAIGDIDDSDSVSSEELKEILAEIQKSQTQPIRPAGQPSAPSFPTKLQVSLDDDPVMGSSDAPVTIVEFSDFQCPFCLRFYEQTLPLLKENYIATGKVKLVYRDLPLDSIHANARPAHIAAECADEQGKFWEYHDVLFEKQTQWQRLPSESLQTTLVQYAGELGLQTASFESCLDSPEIADEVNKDSLDAARYGATGTPTFYVGNEKDGFIKLTGAQPFATFKSTIDSQLG